VALSQSSIDALAALAAGFAFAGLLASGFELVMRRQLRFSALQTGDLGAVATVPVLVFSAPLIIIRNTILGQRLERRPIPYVMVATMIACFWSMLSGRLVLDLARLVTAA
jgi:hypothetical protein